MLNVYSYTGLRLLKEFKIESVIKLHKRERMGVSVFQCPLFMFCTVLSSEKVPAFCSPQVRGAPPNCVHLLIYGP